MPFVIFEKKEDQDKAVEIEYDNLFGLLEKKINEPVTCLHRKGNNLNDVVFIYSQSFLDEFDKRGVNYKSMPEEEALQYLSDGGSKYLERLKQLRPDFIV